uniref:Uncharacterized protein n=1 Tax=Panagrolaimus sp. ES5 TaxID=591445 RepID=A0AC34GQU3_9BILA
MVRGTGYTTAPSSSSGSQYKPPSSLAPKRSSVAFGATTRKVRITSQPPISTTNGMKRSGSLGSILTNRIPLVPGGGNNSREGGMPIICNCQHPADRSFMEDIYVQNLERQVRMLELENAFIKQQPSASISSPKHRHQLPATIPSSSLPSTSSNKPYFREDTVTMPHEHEWSSAPGSSMYNSNNSRKRVEFHDKTQTFNGQNQQQQQYSGRSDEELFLQLEDAIKKEQKLDEKLKKQVAENRHLSAVNEDLQAKYEVLTDELQQITGKVTKERRTLLEENIDLQRRLDELTPLLAEKEAQIARILNEKEGLSSRLRTTTTQLSSLQNRLEEQKREESILSEMDSERRQENEKLQQKIRSLENEIEDIRRRESENIEEITMLQKRLKEEKLMAKKESTMHKKAMEETEILIKENSNLSSQLNKLEMIVQQQKADLANQRMLSSREDEISELKQSERNLRNELTRMEDKLRREQESVRSLETQLKEMEYDESGSRQELLKTQKELEGLEALSKSLTNENTGLREEKISLNERIEFLQRKKFQLGEKEIEIHELTESLDEFKRKYNAAMNQLKKDMEAQSERTFELEEIVRRVHELSDSMPHHHPRQPRHHGTTSGTSAVAGTSSRSSSISSRKQFATSSSVVSVESVGTASQGGRRRISERYRRSQDIE